VPRLPPIRRFEKLREILKAGDGKGWLYIDSRDVLDAPTSGKTICTITPILTSRLKPMR